MDLVELEQRGQVLELLVADLEAAVGQRVDDVVRHARVLRHRQHVVAGAGGRVAHQEHAVPLALQPALRLLARHGAQVPGRAVGRVEAGGRHAGGGGRSVSDPGLRRFRGDSPRGGPRATPRLALPSLHSPQAPLFLSASNPQHPPTPPGQAPAPALRELEGGSSIPSRPGRTEPPQAGSLPDSSSQKEGGEVSLCLSVSLLRLLYSRAYAQNEL